MSEWRKNELKEYITSLIDDLDDIEYELRECKGKDFLEIEIEPYQEVE